MKHIKFEDSPIMRSFEKVAIDKGMFETSEVEGLLEKVAAKRQEETLKPSKNLINDMFKLASGLRQKGMIKEAEALEEKIHIYRQAEVHLYDVFNEEGEDLLEFAHPDGDAEVAPASEDYGKVETSQSAHKKIVDKVMKAPTGKFAQMITHDWEPQIEQMTSVTVSIMASHGVEFDDDDVEDCLEKILAEETSLNRIPKGISSQDAQNIANFFRNILNKNAASWANKIKSDMASSSSYIMEQAIDAVVGSVFMSAVVAWQKSKNPEEGGFSATASKLLDKTAEALGLEKKASDKSKKWAKRMFDVYVGALRRNNLEQRVIPKNAGAIVGDGWSIKYRNLFDVGVFAEINRVVEEQLERSGEQPQFDKMWKIYENRALRSAPSDVAHFAKEIKKKIKEPGFIWGENEREATVSDLARWVADVSNTHFAVAWRAALKSTEEEIRKRKEDQEKPDDGITYEYMKLVLSNLSQAQSSFEDWNTDEGALWATKCSHYMRIISSFYKKKTPDDVASFSAIMAGLHKADSGFTEKSFKELLNWSKELRDAAAKKKDASFHDFLRKMGGPTPPGETKPAKTDGSSNPPPPKPQGGGGAKPTNNDKKAVRAMQFAMSSLAETLQKGALDLFPETKKAYPDIISTLISTSADQPEKPVGPSQFDGWWGPNTSEALKMVEALRNEWNQSHPQKLITNPIDTGGTKGLRYVSGHGVKASKNTLTIAELNKKAGGVEASPTADSDVYDIVPAFGDRNVFLDFTREGTIQVKKENLKSLYDFALFLTKNPFTFDPKDNATEPVKNGSIAFHHLWKYIHLFRMRANRISKFNPALHDYLWYVEGLKNDLQRITNLILDRYEAKKKEKKSDDLNMVEENVVNVGEVDIPSKKEYQTAEDIAYIPLRLLQRLGARNAGVVSSGSGLPVAQRYNVVNGKLVPDPAGRWVVENGQAVPEGKSMMLSKQKFSPKTPPIWETLVLERGDFRKHFKGQGYLPELDLDEVRYMDTSQLANLLFGSMVQVDDLTDLTQSNMKELDRFIGVMRVGILPSVYRQWEKAGNRDPRVKKQSRQFLREWDRALEGHQRSIRQGRRPAGRYRRYTYR